MMLSVSKPLVPFRETVQPRGCAHLWSHFQDPRGVVTLKAQSSAASRALPVTFQPAEGSEGGLLLPFWLETVTPTRQCRVRAHVERIPEPLTRVLEKHQAALLALLAGADASGGGLGLGSLGQLMPAGTGSSSSPSSSAGMVHGSNSTFGARAVPSAGGKGDTPPFAEVFQRDIREALEEVESGGSESDTGSSSKSDAQMWRHLLSHIWALGPKHCGPNLLLTPSALTSPGPTLPGRQHREGGGAARGESAAGAENGAPYSSESTVEGPNRREQREGWQGKEEGATGTGTGAGAGAGVLIRGTPEVSQKLRLSLEARGGASGAQGVGLAGGEDSEEGRGAVSYKGTEGGTDRGGSASVAQGEVDREAQSLAGSVMSGFQLATAAGPLCEEPMRGLAFVVEAYLLPDTARHRPSATAQASAAAPGAAPGDAAQHSPEPHSTASARERGTGEAPAVEDEATGTGEREGIGSTVAGVTASGGVPAGTGAVAGGGGVTVGVGGPLSGQLIAAVKEACRGAVLASSPRLAEAMFFCEVSHNSLASHSLESHVWRRMSRVARRKSHFCTLQDMNAIWQARLTLPRPRLANHLSCCPATTPHFHQPTNRAAKPLATMSCVILPPPVLHDDAPRSSRARRRWGRCTRFWGGGGPTS